MRDPRVVARAAGGQLGRPARRGQVRRVESRVEHDCAAGTIVGAVQPGAGGTFEARGTHTPGQGGPERVGFAPPSFPARYSGRVRGDTMTLLIEVPAIAARIGPYTLRRGAEPILLRCL